MISSLQRQLCTQHTTNTRDLTSMPSVGCEPMIPAIKCLHTQALDCPPTGISLQKLFTTLKKGRLNRVYSKQHTHHSHWTDSKDFYYPIFPTNSSIPFMHIPLTERETHIFLITFHIAPAMFRLNKYLIVTLIHSN